MADKINNIGKLFYKDYYKEVKWENILFAKTDEDKVLKIDNTIKKSQLFEINKPISDINSTISATIQYPGLVTGVGLTHDAKVGYKLGMHFDYTYGMPIVYGSSVKGVLKTYFKDFFLKHYPDRESDVESLMKLIFEGKNPEYGEKKDTPKYISIYERDVFFDAVIVDSYEGHFLEDDFITPHPDPLKNPTPIKMLKIAPGCKIEFRFKLNNHKIKDREYTSDFILKIFEDILTTVGIGAKTNVGYGQLKIEEK